MVEAAPPTDITEYVPEATVREFSTFALTALGVSEAHSEVVVDVLISADLRGIRSHGIARLPYFLDRLHSGVLRAQPRITFTRGSDTTGILEADRGLGIIAANEATAQAVAMAGDNGSGFVVVKHSSHFGYAGYWANFAARQGYIGIALSSGGGRTTPTFGLEGILGTNPMAVTIPGLGDSEDFCLDMATSMVAAGKIETAVREGRPVPPTWLPTGAAEPELDDRSKLKHDYPLLPLGGEGDLNGGHKGYGLSLMIELLCGALAEFALSERLGETSESVSSVGHFIGAIDLSGFAGQAAVSSAMHETFEVVRGARKAPGHDRIYVAGELEAIAERENATKGVAVTPSVSAHMREWSERLDLGTSWPAHADGAST